MKAAGGVSDRSQRSLRVAILPPTPVPYREPLFERLAAADGLEVAVVYQSADEPAWDAPSEWFPAAHNYPARHLRSWQRGRAGRTPIVVPRGLRSALREIDPDCVVAWEYGPASLRTFAWCRLHRRRFVIFTECTAEIDRLLSPLQLRLHRWLARRADALIVASSAARARLLAFGVPEKRVKLGIQSADVAPFREVAEIASRTQAPVTILAIGRLVPDKNLGTLLEAYEQAGLSPADARFEIAGTGFMEAELRDLADRLRVPASFRGHVPPNQLPELFADADLYALVSTYEPFGVVIREAAAAGLPIICSRVAGAAGDAAIDGRNAVLVDPANVDEIGAALRKLVEDEPRRRRMGQESRAVDAELDGRDLEAFLAAIAAR